jgi:hypothetical protein
MILWPIMVFQSWMPGRFLPPICWNGSLGAVPGIFPNPDSYLRLVTTYLLEYSEDWSAAKAYISPESLQNTLGNVA